MWWEKFRMESGSLLWLTNVEIQTNKEDMKGVAIPAGALRQRLWNRPAVSNDRLQLELSGAWQPPDSSIPLPDGEGQEALFGFSNGNQSD
jgi:hypothetical protein